MTAETRRVRAGELQPNPWNPNKMPKRKFEALKASIAAEGYLGGIVTRQLDDGSLQIVEGEHRWRALIDVFGVDHVVDVTVADMTEVQAKLNTLALNRIRGEHAPVAEALVMSDLLAKGMSVKDLETRLGMPQDQVEDLVALLGEDPPTPQDRVPMVTIEIALFREQNEVYLAALERALAIVSPKAIPMLDHQAEIVDEAMKKAKRLLDTANRARALEMICANFLATPDEALA